MNITPINPLVIETQVIEALRTVFDPEIPVNIMEVGLIYEIKVDPAGSVAVRMTLTSPNCPSAAELPVEVETKVKAVPGVTAAKVDVVFDPPWEACMMSEAAKLQLNMM
jgi:FeS assembly SUF system protein